eukprot:Gregarina_sp_Pseudo_9__1266@NODE_1840_length_1299_cov_212_959524_g1293_i1_p1_GENE_NODE_1840_length_1299_cov_212_959524_g1293_i1NODE_1840_length_1299_cov_212_959524_g1293_i1_p1_ORF_typecomplete_len259_score57_80_NODE_1840_length_1299_cov_212_959524_g1293_i14221198
MKFLTAVSGFLWCGVLAAETPTLSVKLETAEFSDGAPANCVITPGDIPLEALQACYASTHDYAGTFTYSGYVSAGAWSGAPCMAETADHLITFFSVESLAKYVPEWMRAGGATGTYKVTVTPKTVKECVVSFLVPADPIAKCAAPIIGDVTGTHITVPAGSESFSLQAPDFADSVTIAMAAACASADFAAIASIDATDVKYAFSFNEQSTEPTPNPDEDSTQHPDGDSTEDSTVPGPEGASAHLIIGTLFVLSLVATL